MLGAFVFIYFFFHLILFGIAGFIISGWRGMLWAIIFGPFGLIVAAILKGK